MPSARSSHRRRRGVTAIEYGLLCFLIIVAVIGILSVTGRNLQSVFYDITGTIELSSYSLSDYKAPVFKETSSSVSSAAQTAYSTWTNSSVPGSTINMTNNASGSVTGTYKSVTGLVGVKALPGTTGSFADSTAAKIPSGMVVGISNNGNPSSTMTFRNVPSWYPVSYLQSYCSGLGGRFSSNSSGYNCGVANTAMNPAKFAKAYDMSLP